MREKIISKGDLLQLLGSRTDIKNIYIYSDKKWAYPGQGDTQGTCIMLDMNFNVENKPGIVIHIPNVTIDETGGSYARTRRNRKLYKNKGKRS